MQHTARATRSSCLWPRYLAYHVLSGFDHLSLQLCCWCWKQTCSRHAASTSSSSATCHICSRVCASDFGLRSHLRSHTRLTSSTASSSWSTDYSKARQGKCQAAAGWYRFAYPGRMQGWVDFGGDYIPIWFSRSQTVTHPTSNQSIATWPGIKPTS